MNNAPSAKLFQISIDENLAVNGKDVFKLSNGATPGTISISASTGVAAAMGFNYYLKYVAHSSCRMRRFENFWIFFCLFFELVYWSGKNIVSVSSTLTPLKDSIEINANDLFRWYGNPCTFSYSLVFWNFSR